MDEVTTPTAEEATAPPYEHLQFRGRYYLRGPLSALEYFRLQQLLRHMKEAEAKGEMPEALVEAAAFVKRRLSPLSAFERLTWAVRPNPFRDASVRELGVLLGQIARGALAPSRLGVGPKEVSRG
ncbi:MAG TPA: hypothetical protein VFI96_07060 [Longimicrobiaceae bacterium]|nr:hypothetical protein [Longimicrobiaceae bacterium]